MPVVRVSPTDIEALDRLIADETNYMVAYGEIVNDEDFGGQYDSEEAEKDGFAQGYLQAMKDIHAYLRGTCPITTLCGSAKALYEGVEEYA